LEGKEKKKGESKLEREYQAYSRSYMSFQYEEYKMAVEGAHNDVMIAFDATEEIETIEC